MTRTDGRSSTQLRPTRMTPGFLAHAEGSVLIEVGRTKVVCAASVEDRVPPFLRNTGKGWVTAEYGMLPRATSTRTQRESTAGKVDGRTRTASITGGFVALVLALGRMKELAVLKDIPVVDYVAATSVGIVDGAALLDLAYEEDSRAEVDMNLVKTGDGRFIELQGTAEGPPFDKRALEALMELADTGIRELIALQKTVVGDILK